MADISSALSLSIFCVMVLNACHGPRHCESSLNGRNICWAELFSVLHDFYKLMCCVGLYGNKAACLKTFQNLSVPVMSSCHCSPATQPEPLLATRATLATVGLLLSMLNRKQLVQAAQLAEQCGRYKDMASTMRQLVTEWKGPLTYEEKNLLSEAYKLLIQEYCSSWRRLKQSVEEGVVKQKEQAQVYRETIKQELEAQCWEILSLLDHVLLKHCSETDYESQAFYLKMKGDSYRYLAEVAQPDNRETLVKSAEKAYGEAQEISQWYMEPTHPLTLSLALNYSILYYEVLNNPQQAIALAKTAFDKAIADLEALSLEYYKDSTAIMQHLRDNIVRWTGDQPQQADDHREEPED